MLLSKKTPKGTIKTKSLKIIASTQSLSGFVKTICDIMRRSNCASALQYVPELTWILFLRILDAQEARAREEAAAVGADFSPALRSPYRWQDWAAPYSVQSEHQKTAEGKPFGWKRQELFAAGDGEEVRNHLREHLEVREHCVVLVWFGLVWFCCCCFGHVGCVFVTRETT